MSTISLHSGVGATLLAMSSLVAIVVMVVGYARVFRSVPRSGWTTLCGLRLAAILAVLVLIAQPVLSVHRELDERPGLVFAFDRSGSMGIADEPNGASRMAQVILALVRWREQLNSRFNIRLVEFAEAAGELRSDHDFAGLATVGQSTSLARGLTVAQKAAVACRADAVIVLSDGVHNAAGDPLAAARQVGVPVHTIGVGNALQNRQSLRDIRVTDLAVPPQLVVDNRARVRGFVDAIGYGNRLVEIILQEDGQSVAERQLSLDDLEGSQEVEFEFVPRTKGVHKYTVRVPTGPEERIPQNNERSTSSLVIAARIRVLYIEGTLRAEYGALVGRFLTKDPNLEFSALVQTRPNLFQHRTNIEGWRLDTIPDDSEILDTFQVVILGDLDSTYVKTSQLERIRERVQAGAGLLMLGGYHSLGPGGYQATPLAECLPVELGDRQIGQLTEPFLPRLTGDGRSHPIFANIARFFPTDGAEAETTGLPELLGSVRVGIARPAATVLAVHPEEQIQEKPMPVLAVQPYGAGRTAVFTADTTRNWHQVLRSQDDETPFLRFWGQLVRWLAGRQEQFESAAGVVAFTDRGWYPPETPVEVRAVVRGPEGEAISPNVIQATITGPNGKLPAQTLQPVTGPAGNFATTFQPPRTGRYVVQVAATLGAQTLTAEPLEIEVGRENLEFEQPELNEYLLTQIAVATGGKYAHLSTADRLIEQLEQRLERRRVDYELELAWAPFWWSVFVVSLTTEWLLRRRQRLR